MKNPYKKRLGDRKDGRKVRTLDPMAYVAAVIMKNRNDATNYFEYKIDMGPITSYIQKKRQEEHMKGFGFMHVLTAAFVRVISQKPAMNRFISGNKIYQRDDVVFSMMVKKKMSEDGQETGIKLRFDRSATSYDVYNKMNEAIEEGRFEGDSTALDKAARLVTIMPTGLMRAFIGIVRLLDYYGLMPKALDNASPFHASFFLSNLGSLGIPPIYHHIYNFGNVSTFLTFGAKESEYVLDKDGNTVKKEFTKLMIVVDERIADGYYMAKSFRYLLRVLKHPEMLDNPPEKVFEDIE